MYLNLSRPPSGRFRCACSQVDKAVEGWTGETGHVNASLVETHLPKPSSDAVIFVCGPPGMMNVSAVNGVVLRSAVRVHAWLFSTARHPFPRTAEHVRVLLQHRFDDGQRSAWVASFVFAQTVIPFGMSFPRGMVPPL